MRHFLPYLCGRRFGRLVVTDLAARRQHGAQLYWYWECSCDCGAAVEIQHNSLMSGKTQSCGCLARQVVSFRNTKHGKSGTLEYDVWYGIVARCTRPTHFAFKDYGGRGIILCEGWGTFTAFSTDIGERPTPDHTIDRIDNDGGYWCGHCEQCIANGWPMNWRWATRKEQSLNRRNTRYVEADGERLRLDQWAERLNTTVAQINTRLKRGWPEDKAVTIPVLRVGTSRKGKSLHQRAWEQ